MIEYLCIGKGGPVGLKDGKTISAAELLFGDEKQIYDGRPLSIEQYSTILVQIIPRMFHDREYSTLPRMIQIYYTHKISVTALIFTEYTVFVKKPLTPLLNYD
jgi:hypothetical protein